MREKTAPFRSARKRNQSCPFLSIYSLWKRRTKPHISLSLCSTEQVGPLEFLWRESGYGCLLCHNPSHSVLTTWACHSPEPTEKNLGARVHICDPGTLRVGWEENTGELSGSIGPVSLEHRTRWGRYNKRDLGSTKWEKRTDSPKLSSDILTCPMTHPCFNTQEHTE